MGIFDDMAAIIGKGIDAADHKSQIIKAQSAISQNEKQKTALLAELRRAVLTKEAGNGEFAAAYATHIRAISAEQGVTGEASRTL